VGPPLAIKVLEVTTSPASGPGHHVHSTPNPTWGQVESAIRALDRHGRPFVFIGLREACEGEGCLSVLGGPKGYAISAADSWGGWLQYCDPSHAGGDVPVWTSDQEYYLVRPRAARHRAPRRQSAPRVRPRQTAPDGSPRPRQRWHAAGVQILSYTITGQQLRAPLDYQ
jgi:hypothetical protein